MTRLIEIIVDQPEEYIRLSMTIQPNEFHITMDKNCDPGLEKIANYIAL